MHQALTSKIGFKISLVGRLLRKGFDRRVAPLGVTRAQWRTLHAIHHNSGLKQRQLAEILEVESVTVGRFIDRLEALGWIERQPDPEDRRAYRLVTTATVEPLFHELETLGDEEEEVALSGLSPEDRVCLAGYLDQIAANLAQSMRAENADDQDADKTKADQKLSAA